MKINCKRSISILLITALLIFASGATAFAQTVRDFPYVTFEDNADFTIVDQGLNTFEDDITLMGLDSSIATVQFQSHELPYITWTSDSLRVLLIDNIDPWNFGFTLTGTDSVAALIIGGGTSYITATYDTPTAAPVSVSSYVVAEGIFTTPSVSGIDVSVDFPEGAVDGNNNPLHDFTWINLTVPLFDLSDAGITYNDDDVLKRMPTALHALLFALELEFDPDGANDITDPNWDWDWVIENVIIYSEGSYVFGIGSAHETWMNGEFYAWQSQLDGVSIPPYHAGAHPLSVYNTVHWHFAPSPYIIV